MSNFTKWLREWGERKDRILAHFLPEQDIGLVRDFGALAALQHEALILALCCCETTNACWLHDESLDESMKQWTNEREIAKWGNARGAIKAAEALKERYE